VALGAASAWPQVTGTSFPGVEPMAPTARQPYEREPGTMDAAERHIFVCCSFRGNGTPQGVCHKKNSVSFLPYLEEELSDRGMQGVQVSSSGCLKACDRGPVLVVYPENWWFGNIEGEDDVDAILDSIEKGVPDEDYLLT
jgi:(2Fe-2S) ferredoxin